MSQQQTAFKDWREGRRKRALELKAQGWKQRQIAQALGVSEAAVSQWIDKQQAQGEDAWRTKPHRQGPLKLSLEQLRLLPALLSHGAQAYGFRGEVWTCARVAMVIQEEFGVRYHRGHVARLLKELDWTPQMPQQQAAQRDEAEIERWRLTVWPALKKRQSAKAAS
jgi:transposase